MLSYLISENNNSNTSKEDTAVKALKQALQLSWKKHKAEYLNSHNIHLPSQLVTVEEYDHNSPNVRKNLNFTYQSTMLELCYHTDEY